jgi:cysteine desulfuration protein SufE
VSSSYPPKLAEIVEFFEQLSDEEKRENLIAYADSAAHCGPKPGDIFDLEDTRKDEECTDTVGVYLRVEAGTRRAHFALTLGPQVQTLTKAMTAILCRGLDGASPEAVMDVPPRLCPQNRRWPTRAPAQSDRVLHSHAHQKRLQSLAQSRASGHRLRNAPRQHRPRVREHAPRRGDATPENFSACVQLHLRSSL